MLLCPPIKPNLSLYSLACMLWHSDPNWTSPAVAAAVEEEVAVAAVVVGETSETAAETGTSSSSTAHWHCCSCPGSS